MAKTFYVNGDLGRVIIADSSSPASPELMTQYSPSTSSPYPYAEFTNFYTAMPYLQLKATITKSSATFSSLTPDQIYWDTGGCDCFSADTLISMADGTKKQISLVNVGDKVFGKNGSINTVTFIEKVTDSIWGQLYSPDPKLPPFITINHPIYIKDELFGPNMANIKSLYPWLGDIKELPNFSCSPASGDLVYNLWVTGDGTYCVNGYFTHSIMFNGKFLSYCFSKGWLTQKQVTDIMRFFTSHGRYIQYGAFIVNKNLLSIKSDFLLNRISANLLKPNSISRKAILKIGNLLGRRLHPFKE